MKRAACLGLGLVAAACASPTGSAPAAVPSSAPPPVAGPDLGETPFSEVVSERFGLALSLPDAGAWRIDDHREPWLVATHDASQSTLRVRLFREDENMNRERCEAKARGFRELPRREGADVFERRRVGVPEEFDTRLDLGVVASPQAGRVSGFALAFGGWAKRCFAFAYTTTTEGRGAEQRLAGRLAAIGKSLESVTLRSSLSPAVPRRPGVSR